MILKLSNKENTYTFTVDDLNNGEKLYYKFQIPASDVVDGKYNMVLMDDDGNIITEEQVCMGYFNAETIQYNRGENVYINSPLNANLEDVRTITIDVPNYTIYPSEGYDAMKEVVVDAQPVYDNGYNEGENIGYNSGYTAGDIDGYNRGYNEGETDQKAKLTGITITENGTYSREDGYNEITVDVPDLNGDYNEGYDAGKVDGYDSGYTAGIDYASENAGEIAAANAIDLVATKFGTYYTKYSDNIVNPNPVTGIYPDGEKFYNYSTGKYFYNTGVKASTNSKIEIWFYNDDVDNFGFYIFKAFYSFSLHIKAYGEGYTASIGDSNIDFTLEVGWHHLAMSFADGLVVDGEKIGDFNYNVPEEQYIEIGGYIMTTSPNLTIGMIKIDDYVIIPTADGFLNTTTNQLLQKLADNVSYSYINNIPPSILNNLIKSVNVQPKIDVNKYGLKFSNSTFKEIPVFFDFSNITDVVEMFYYCKSLQTIPLIDTSKVTNMNSFLRYCSGLQSIPLIDTSNVTNMERTFSDCGSLQSLPAIDTSNVENANRMLNSCGSLQSVPALNAEKMNLSSYGMFGGTLTALTDFGGLIGLKSSSNNSYSFNCCPNLNYQSCINILNGLYDFTGNGETPASNQGQLKVHPNFLTTVGDEISIGTLKGWQISA